MAIVIDDVETEKLVQELAALTGESEEAAILISVLERLKRMQPRGTAKSVADEVNAIALRCASLPHVEAMSHLSDDEILGYDEFGIPTK